VVVKKEMKMTEGNIFSGLKVVDLASFIAGPCAATILSDFGADVVKVEPPDGELWRIGQKILIPSNWRIETSVVLRSI
jgi:crotonobetainyl-CoA:carnitine CoA-transferase CaiB-like acyl-CoA transferase